MFPPSSPGPRDTLEFHNSDIHTFGKLIITLFYLFHGVNYPEKSAATTFSLLAVIQIAIVAFWKWEVSISQCWSSNLYTPGDERRK